MKVEPIKSKKKIIELFQYLYKQHPRNGLLFLFGVNTGERISDILTVKKGDLFTAKGNFRDYWVLTEKKTGKEKKVFLNASLKKEVLKYCQRFKIQPKEYLFFSLSNLTKPMCRMQAWRILTTAAKTCGIENFGTHTMRKSLGYHVYKDSQGDIGLVMRLLNHSNMKDTLRYIGIDQETMDKAYKGLDYFGG
jgi:integrase